MARIQVVVALFCLISVAFCLDGRIRGDPVNTSTNTTSTVVGSSTEKPNGDSTLSSTSDRTGEPGSDTTGRSGSDTPSSGYNATSSSGVPINGPSSDDQGSTSDKSSFLTQQINSSSTSGRTSEDGVNGGDYTSTSGKVNDPDYNGTSTSGPYYPDPVFPNYGGDRWNGTKGDSNSTSNEDGGYTIPGPFGGNITVTPYNWTSNEDPRGNSGSIPNGDYNNNYWNKTEGDDRNYDAPIVFPNSTTIYGCQFTGKRNETETTNSSYHIYDINTIGQFRLALQYLQSGKTSNTSILGFAMKAINVFEYNEVNGVKGFQEGDQVTGSYDLSGAPFNPIDIQSFDITSSTTGLENTLWKVTASTVDQVFAASITFSGIPIMVGETQLSPDSMKIDIAIRWFTAQHQASSWTTGPSSASTYPRANVALTVAAAASTTNSYVSSNTPALNSSNPSVNFNNSDVSGFFSWEPTAFLNHGQSSTQVVASFGDSSAYKSHFVNGYEVAAAIFSFPGDRPAYVLWDPEFGSSKPVTATAAGTPNSKNVSSSSVAYPLVALIVMMLAML